VPVGKGTSAASWTGSGVHRRAGPIRPGAPHYHRHGSQVRRALAIGELLETESSDRSHLPCSRKAADRPLRRAGVARPSTCSSSSTTSRRSTRASRCRGVAREREGNDFYHEMIEAEVINLKNITESKVAMVFGQMNEPPGNRLRVGLTAHHGRVFPRRSRDILFSSTTSTAHPRGTECRRCSAACPRRGYQPPSRRKWAACRSASLRPDRFDHSVRRSTCPPTTSPTRRPPLPSATSTRPCALARHRLARHLPGGPRLDLAPRSTRTPSARTTQHHASVQATLQPLQGAADINRILGMGPPPRQARVSRARKIQRFLSQPFSVEELHRPGRQYVQLKDTIRASR